MLSRLRSNAKAQSFVKATCNPEPKEAEGGWIHEFLDDYFLDDYGYPIPDRSGDIRWFVSDVDGNLDWADNSAELKVKHGLDCEPMSFTFISATVIDNPVLCKLQPAYLTALKNLGRVERERLLYGGWNVNPVGAGYFQRQWVDFVDAREVPKRLRTIRCWDLAASIKSELNSDPDSTAGVKISLCEDGFFYVESAKEVIARPAGVERILHDTAEFDGKNCPIGIPKDSAAGGIIQFQHYARPLIVKGYKIKKMEARKSKLERFTGFSNAAENGLVILVRGEWNDKYIKQLEDFDPERRRQHDD